MTCCSEQTYTFVSVEMEASCAMFGFLLIFFITFFTLRMFWIILNNAREACDRRIGPLKMMVVVGSGGHTMEMLRLLSGIPQQFSPKLYVIAMTDNKSMQKVFDFEKIMDEKHKGKSKFEIKQIPRSREVGQSYFTSILSTLVSLFSSLFLVMKEQPDIILCNGPGTCVPVCLSGFLLKVLMVKDVKIVYVESICRVKTLSLTAKILYYFVDRLIVQWPDLYEKYQRTVYLGRII